MNYMIAPRIDSSEKWLISNADGPFRLPRTIANEQYNSVPLYIIKSMDDHSTKANVIDKVLFWFASAPWIHVAVICIVAITVILMVGAVFSVSPRLAISTTQVHYLSSTSAQVIAALYGLTVAGYSFFASNKLPNSLDDSEEQNLFGEVARGYHKEIVLLTIACLFSIILMIANLIIDSTSIEKAIQDFVLNSSMLGLFVFMIALFFFVIQVVDPGRLQKYSAIAKTKIYATIEENTLEKPEPTQVRYAVMSLDHPTSYTGDFLKVFNKIESELLRFVEADRLPKDRYPSMGFLISALREDGKISQSWVKRLRDLRQYRNYVVHDIDGTPVPLSALLDAQNTLKDLRASNSLADETRVS